MLIFLVVVGAVEYILEGAILRQSLCRNYQTSDWNARIEVQTFDWIGRPDGQQPLEATLAENKTPFLAKGLLAVDIIGPEVGTLNRGPITQDEEGVREEKESCTSSNAKGQVHRDPELAMNLIQTTEGHKV